MSTVLLESEKAETSTAVASLTLLQREPIVHNNSTHFNLTISKDAAGCDGAIVALGTDVFSKQTTEYYDEDDIPPKKKKKKNTIVANACNIQVRTLNDWIDRGRSKSGKIKSANSVDTSANVKGTTGNQEDNAIALRNTRTSLLLLANMKDMDHDLKIDINQHVYKFTRLSYLVGSSVAKGKRSEVQGSISRAVR